MTRINTQDLSAHQEDWEKVVLKLRAHQMPPQGARQPDQAAHAAALTSLETALDGLAAAAPNPGRTDTFRRLNRTEYRNAIRDLLALDIDPASLLPSDSASFGFDNITVGTLSPTLLESYVSAAEKISQLAVGRPGLSVGGTTARIKPDITQEGHIEGLPLGTRGGALMSHAFPMNGEYEITIRLARDRNEHIEGLFEPHEVELLLDGERVRLFTIEPISLTQGVSSADSASHATLDSHMKVRLPVQRGSAHAGRDVPQEAVAASWKPPGNRTRRISTTTAIRACSRRSTRFRSSVRTIPPVPAIRRAAAGCSRARPASQKDEDGCARNILSTLMRRAYRRPVH